MEEQALRDQAAQSNDFRVVEEEKGVDPTPVAANAIRIKQKY